MAEKQIHLAAQDGTRIAGTVWEAEKPKGVLLWIHGYSEHRRRYAHFGNWMVSNRITVAAIDVRGHGESQGRRGHVTRFEDYFQDVNVLMHWSRENHAKDPLILGCHSHGGLIVSRYLEQGIFPRQIEAAIFTSPFLGLGLKVPPWKMSLANRMSSWIPTLTVPTGLPPEYVSHDEKIVMAYRNDPMIFTKATARWFTEAVKNQQLAVEKAGQINLPTLVMQGLDDRIVSVDASRRFYQNLGKNKDNQWIEYPGLFHEILNEVDRVRVYDDMLNWIKKRI